MTNAARICRLPTLIGDTVDLLDVQPKQAPHAWVQLLLGGTAMATTDDQLPLRTPAERRR